jgi:hypothetical protein
MIELLRLILHVMASLFKPRAKLVAEILVLRQQLNVLRRQVSKRTQLSNTDRFNGDVPAFNVAEVAQHLPKVIPDGCRTSGPYLRKPRASWA